MNSTHSLATSGTIGSPQKKATKHRSLLARRMAMQFSELPEKARRAGLILSFLCGKRWKTIFRLEYPKFGQSKPRAFLNPKNLQSTPCRPRSVHVKFERMLGGMAFVYAALSRILKSPPPPGQPPAQKPEASVCDHRCFWRTSIHL